MAYVDKVWAVISGIDGVTAHLAEQVVAKARLTLIDQGSTDKTVNMAYVPWTFSLAPSDAAIAEALYSAVSAAEFVVFSATDHDSRASSSELLSLLRRQHRTPRRHVEFAPGALAADALAAQADAPVAVVIAGPVDSARLIIALRHSKPAVVIYGGPACARQSFREAAGTAARGVNFPELGAGDPDCAATYGYQAVRLLVEAVRKAGLNRARVRDAVQESGSWNELNRRERPVRMGQW